MKTQVKYFNSKVFDDSSIERQRDMKAILPSEPRFQSSVSAFFRIPHIPDFRTSKSVETTTGVTHLQN
jgi:hypothetical protein